MGVIENGVFRNTSKYQFRWENDHRQILGCPIFKQPQTVWGPPVMFGVYKPYQKPY
jgi:hypothetical protein